MDVTNGSERGRLQGLRMARQFVPAPFAVLLTSAAAGSRCVRGGVIGDNGSERGRTEWLW
jgi:hypothetical protein